MLLQSQRAVYYGRQLAQQFVESRVAPCRLKVSANVTAYQGEKLGRTMLAVVNKAASPVGVSLPTSLHGCESMGAERAGSGR